MRFSNFWKEKVIAGGIVFGGTLIVIGMRVMTTSFRVASYDTYRHSDPLFYVGGVVFLLGIAIALATLLMGFGFATGLGFKRKIPQALIEERISMMRDGTSFIEDVPEGVPLRFYLRLRMPDGEVVEAVCSRELFERCRQGMTGIADLQGQRLISFSRTS